MTAIRPLTIATARFQNGIAIRQSGLTPVRITRGAPRFRLDYHYANLPELAPTRAQWNLPEAEFDRAYMAMCDQHGVDLLRRRFTEIAGGSAGVVLLCYEDLRKHGPNGCHRRVFARWWMRTVGEPVDELPEEDGRPRLF